MSPSCENRLDPWARSANPPITTRVGFSAIFAVNSWRNFSIFSAFWARSAFGLNFMSFYRMPKLDRVRTRFNLDSSGFHEPLQELGTSSLHLRRGRQDRTRCLDSLNHRLIHLPVAEPAVAMVWPT